MALSFLYLAFVRRLQLLRPFRRDNEELAIEVVMRAQVICAFVGFMGHRREAGVAK